MAVVKKWKFNPATLKDGKPIKVRTSVQIQFRLAGAAKGDTPRWRLPLLVRSHSARSARMGSVRVARQAGKKHAAVDARIITAKATAKASGSRGLT